MTRGELRTRIARALNDDPGAPILWHLDELNRLIDEGSEVLAEEAEALTRTVHVPLRPGTMVYTLEAVQAEIMAPYRLWSQPLQRRLEGLTMRQLDAQYARWQTVTGTPAFWFPVSWDVFGLWPIPTTGGGVVDVSCFVWPDPLLDDGDEAEWATPDVEGLLNYVLTEGYVKQWDIARALPVALGVAASWKDSRARHGLRAIQNRWFARDDSAGE